ncbi:DNA methyltransferase [Helicobacter bizzozeronii]|uniref:DNA methyltransferase n=1 Tax=Helicobacter bizzozeronii TaxID=56877 RepID=UPI000CEF080D|nr:DNA methyltransferase [Helicobacter bizzozeronii]
MLYKGDCLQIIQGLSSDSIDMIYLDPPFYTQKQQKLVDSQGKEYAFADLWESKETYLSYMETRLQEMHRLLKASGNLFCHCDTSASHYLKVLLDKIFGENNFRSEIIWAYKRWSNAQKGLIPNHQTILYYSKTDHYKFNTLFKDYSPTTNIDQILQQRERDAKGKCRYKRDTEGAIVSAKEKRGVPLSDVWEIPFLNPKAKERVGYPTQKPIELLERLIQISTDENDTILDPFCGSGTTLVSAKLLHRKSIGIDISQEAIHLTQQRLDKPYKTHSRLLKVGADAYKTKSDHDLAILDQFDCTIVQRNKGIDALLKRHYLGAPVALKIKKQEESLTEAIYLLDTAAKKRHCSFTILIVDGLLTGEVAPDNMIIIKKYNVEAHLKMEQIIKDKIQTRRA